MQAERDLQREVMVRLLHAPLDGIIFPIPNGIWLPARTEGERSLVSRLIARMKADGMLTPGAPDLVILAEGFAGCLELKRAASRSLLGRTPKGRLSDEQKAFSARCDEYGVPYAVCSSWSEVRDTLIEWGRLPENYTDPDTRIGDTGKASHLEAIERAAEHGGFGGRR